MFPLHVYKYHTQHCITWYCIFNNVLSIYISTSTPWRDGQPLPCINVDKAVDKGGPPFPELTFTPGIYLKLSQVSFCFFFRPNESVGGGVGDKLLMPSSDAKLFMSRLNLTQIKVGPNHENPAF